MSDNYSKTFAISWQYCKNEPAVDSNGATVNFTSNNGNINSFKIEEITGKTGGNSTKKVEIIVPLK